MLDPIGELSVLSPSSFIARIEANVSTDTLARIRARFFKLFFSVEVQIIVDNLSKTAASGDFSIPLRGCKLFDKKPLSLFFVDCSSKWEILHVSG